MHEAQSLPSLADLDELERSLDEIDWVLAQLELNPPAPPTPSQSGNPSPAP